MFNKNSMIVKIWVSLVMGGTYTREQVPKLFNLKTVAEEVLNEVLAG